MDFTFRGEGKAGGTESPWVPTSNTGVANLMQSYEARPGMTVRVREGNRRRALRGKVGTVEDSWGDPEYPALDVRLEDGRVELFWFYELDRLDGPSAN